MMVLCGGTVAALRLATGVLFRGIFPRLASCHNQRRQRQWIDFRESTVLLWWHWWHWWHMSNAGLLILGMLTKFEGFEGTAASTWPLVTTGFSKHPRHEGSKLGKHRGKNDQSTRGYHLPTMSWSNPVTTYSIHPQFLHAQLLPGLCPCSAHFLDAAKVRATLRHPSFTACLSLHVSSAHLCWSLLKWGSCLSSLLVVPPWTRHLCRPYQTASDSLAIPAHTRWPNMAKQRNGVSEIICAERDEKERVKSQHDSKLDCKLDWRAPDDELSLGLNFWNRLSQFFLHHAAACRKSHSLVRPLISAHGAEIETRAITRNGRTSDCS